MHTASTVILNVPDINVSNYSKKDGSPFHYSSFTMYVSQSVLYYLYVHRDNQYKIQQEMLARIFGGYQNMSGEYACKCSKNAQTLIFSVCMCLVFFRILDTRPNGLDNDYGILNSVSTCKNMQNKICMDFLPFSEISANAFFHAFGNYTSTYRRHFLIWKIYLRGLLPVYVFSVLLLSV